MIEGKDNSIITVQMNCPQHKVGELIGKRGIIVQEIMKRSGCKVYVDQNFPEGHPRQIQLTGNPNALSSAVSLVSQVIECGPSVLIPSAENYMKMFDPNKTNIYGPNTSISEDMMIPHLKVGTVIGFKGCNVNEIMRRSGCRVQVLQDNVPDGVDRKVLFAGSPSQIVLAKSLVAAVVAEGPGALTVGSVAGSDGSINPTNPNRPISPNGPGNGILTQEVDVQPEKVKLIIGAKGVTITEIMKRSGARMVINQNFPSGQPRKILFTGTSSQIEIAKYLVETIEYFGMSGLHNVLGNNAIIVVQEINIFQSLILRLLGGDQGHAMTLNEIQTTMGVKITIDTNPVMSSVPGPSGFLETTNKVTVVGKQDSVYTAVGLIYQHTGNSGVAEEVPLSMGGQDPSKNSFDRSISFQSYGSSSGQSHQQQPQPQYQQQQQQSVDPVLALGSDGMAGHLESAGILADGMSQQTAVIKNEYTFDLLGLNNMNLAVIRKKSGASVEVLPEMQGSGVTKVRCTGKPLAVTLAAQMIQEVLVNGLSIVQAMPDIDQESVSAMAFASPKLAIGLDRFNKYNNIPGDNHLSGHLIPSSYL